MSHLPPSKHNKINRFFLLILILLQPALLSAGDISWFTGYDEALVAAQSSNKNMFILITAPSWCGWCVKLENNVLSTEEFQDYISKNYIALKLLDKVDGKENTELSRFDFGGFPTVFLYDSQGTYIRDAYTQNPDEMITTLKNNVNAVGRNRPSLSELQLPEKYIQTDGSGEYVNNGDGTWTVTTSGESQDYSLRSFDYKYLYLSNPSDDSLIALSMSGSDVHLGRKNNEKWEWTNLPNVSRVGGDKYYD